MVIIVQTRPSCISIIYSVSHCDVPHFHYTSITVLDHLCGGCLPFQQKDFSQGNTLAYLLEIVCLGSCGGSTAVDLSLEEEGKSRPD